MIRFSGIPKREQLALLALLSQQRSCYYFPSKRRYNARQTSRASADEWR